MAESIKLVIVGGVAGGASAAARARRLSEDALITILERGEHISFASCGLPYHIGGSIPERERLLVQTVEGMHNRYRVDARVNSEVVAIDRAGKRVQVRDVKDGTIDTIPYDKLILSPGARPIVPPLPGVGGPNIFTLRNLTDMDDIKAAVDAATDTRAVVVGGGYIGLEMAEALTERGMEVTLVELTHQVMGPVDPEMTQPLCGQLKLHGVDLRLNTSALAFRESAAGVDVELSTGETVSCALVVLAVGVKPETDLAAAAGLEIGKLGGIVVDEYMRTSDPDIFAVGDAVEVRDLVFDEPTLVPLAGPANRQGRIAADNVFGRNSKFGKVQGTGVCKVFDLTVAMTGANEKALLRHGRSFEKIYVHAASHAAYYPGAMPISLKLLFDRKDGRILGAQAVGAVGVDKRIDVLATALRAGMTVFDLEELELAYAPPYGNAKDPVNYAGFVAANVLRGDAKLCHTAEVAGPAEDQVVLDVRTEAEVAEGMVPGALHIPVDELRERLDELPADKEVLAYCKVGLRGYVACRILEQHGVECRNYTGGWTTWEYATEALPLEEAQPHEIRHEADGL